jgi:hypothetical protein
MPGFRSALTSHLTGFWLAAMVVLNLCGCRKQAQDPVGELEKTAAAMAQPAPAQAPDAAEAGLAQPPPGPPPAKLVQEALADYQAGKMEDAVTRLQLLRGMSTLTPQQRMALQDSVAAVMTELYTLAAKGDARAKAAIARYELMQNRR